MGWTSTEKLFICFEDCQFVIFSNTGKLLSRNRLFDESLFDTVRHANVSANGFFAYTLNNKMFSSLLSFTLVSMLTAMRKSLPERFIQLLLSSLGTRWSVLAY